MPGNDFRPPASSGIKSWNPFFNDQFSDTFVTKSRGCATTKARNIDILCPSGSAAMANREFKNYRFEITTHSQLPPPPHPHHWRFQFNKLEFISWTRNGWNQTDHTPGEHTVPVRCKCLCRYRCSLSEATVIFIAHRYRVCSINWKHFLSSLVKGQKSQDPRWPCNCQCCAAKREGDKGTRWGWV